MDAIVSGFKKVIVQKNRILVFTCDTHGNPDIDTLVYSVHTLCPLTNTLMYGKSAIDKLFNTEREFIAAIKRQEQEPKLFKVIRRNYGSKDFPLYVHDINLSTPLYYKGGTWDKFRISKNLRSNLWDIEARSSNGSPIYTDVSVGWSTKKEAIEDLEHEVKKIDERNQRYE